MQLAREQRTHAMLKDPELHFVEGQRPDGRRKIYNGRNDHECVVFAEDGRTVEYFTGAASEEWRKAVTLWLTGGAQSDPERGGR